MQDNNTSASNMEERVLPAAEWVKAFKKENNQGEDFDKRLEFYLNKFAKLHLQAATPAPPVSGEKVYRWVKVKQEDKEVYPKTEGKYVVKMYTGSMSPKIIVTESNFTLNGGNRPQFSGAFDWNYVIEWQEEIQLPASPVKSVEEETFTKDDMRNFGEDLLKRFGTTSKPYNVSAVNLNTWLRRGKTLDK